MNHAKLMVIMVFAIFIFTVSATCAADENGTTMATDENNQMGLTLQNKLQTIENDNILEQTDNAESNSKILSSGEGTYSDLRVDIASKNLTKSYYRYNAGDGDTIEIDTPGVINGNGAVIDMAGSNMQALNVTVSRVTINNLTIKNANVQGHGGAIYFMDSGAVTNCNFTNNTAEYGGSVYFLNNGEVINCNFTGNTATDGGAIYYSDGTTGEAINCNFKDNLATSSGGALVFLGTGTVTGCNFINNAGNSGSGGAIYFIKGTMSECNFTNNKAIYGGAIYFNSNGNVTDCCFTNNQATGNSGCGGAVYFDVSSFSNAVNCNFTNNTASGEGGAVYFLNTGNVTNCNFVNNTASEGGGAIRFSGTGTVSNCNFTDNSAGRGGAINMGSGTVKNCNFTNNKATGDYSYGSGGAVHLQDTGSLTNCNFVDNKATGDYSYGGAVYFLDQGTVTNCTFADNKATGTNSWGGAIYFDSTGTVTNCNFTDNIANRYGGAVYFFTTGSVSNCNFTDNSASGNGGAVYFFTTGSVSNCNFTGNTATGEGGAVYFNGMGDVSNCNFTNNSASYGGGVYFINQGTVTNCNFTGNNATRGSAIYFYSTSATKTIFNSILLNNRANAEDLEIIKNDNNFTITLVGGNNLLNAIYSRDDAEVTFTNVTYWSANGIANTGNSPTTPARSKYEAGQNITVGVIVNGELVLDEVKVTDENGMIVLDVSVGENYYITARHGTDSYYTEAEKTITNNTKFNVNVTSQTTNNRTVNITAKSNIPNDAWKGKLRFTLPRGVEINANYGGNGTWWAVYAFGEYDDYQVGATYVGLDNVTVNNATITIIKLNSTIIIEDVVLDYGKSIDVNVTVKGATGITAKIDGNRVGVVDNYIIPISGLDAGNYTLTVTTIADPDHNSVTKKVNITVFKVNSALNIDDINIVYGESINYVAAADGATGVAARIDGEDITVIDDYTIVIPSLDAGSYILTVMAIPDNNHNAISKTVNITVCKADSALTIEKINFDESFIVVAANGAIGVTARIDGVDVAVVDNYTIVIPSLAAGNHILSIATLPDANHNPVTKNATVEVNRLQTVLSGDDVIATYNVNGDLVITLKDSKGNALSSASVTVDLNGAKTYTTDSNGQIKVSTKGLAPKTYAAKVTFNGDTNYVNSTKEIKITVKKATPKLTAKKKTFKKSVKVKKYSIVLKDNLGKAVKNAKVTVKVGKKKFNAKTNSKGKATFKIKKLTKKGTYKATVTYKGNAYYNKVTKKVNIIIR